MLEDICKMTQQYDIYTIEISTPQPYNKNIIQTDDLELEFSKVFTEYIKSIQYHNSQRANSIFTNEVFAIIYTYLVLLETTESQSTSPIQSSKQAKVRKEITAFSTFPNAIRENFYSNDVSQNTKLDLQKILAKQEKTLDPRVTTTTLSLLNNQIMFGTLIVLTHYLKTSQLTSQVKQYIQYLFIQII